MAFRSSSRTMRALGLGLLVMAGGATALGLGSARSSSEAQMGPADTRNPHAEQEIKQIRRDLDKMFEQRYDIVEPNEQGVDNILKTELDDDVKVRYWFTSTNIKVLLDNDKYISNDKYMIVDPSQFGTKEKRAEILAGEHELANQWYGGEIPVFVFGNGRHWLPVLNRNVQWVRDFIDSTHPEKETCEEAGKEYRNEFEIPMNMHPRVRAADMGVIQAPYPVAVRNAGDCGPDTVRVLKELFKFKQEGRGRQVSLPKPSKEYVRKLHEQEAQHHEGGDYENAHYENQDSQEDYAMEAQDEQRLPIAQKLTAGPADWRTPEPMNSLRFEPQVFSDDASMAPEPVMPTDPKAQEDLERMPQRFRQYSSDNNALCDTTAVPLKYRNVELVFKGPLVSSGNYQLVGESSFQVSKEVFQGCFKEVVETVSLEEDATAQPVSKDVLAMFTQRDAKVASGSLANVLSFAKLILNENLTPVVSEDEMQLSDNSEIDRFIMTFPGIEVNGGSFVMGSTSHQSLFLLVTAADKLGFEPLLEVCAKKIAKVLDTLTVEQMVNYFGVPEDDRLSPEQFAAVSRQNDEEWRAR